MVRNRGIGDFLADLEADDALRARFEMELLTEPPEGNSTLGDANDPPRDLHGEVPDH